MNDGVPTVVSTATDEKARASAWNSQVTTSLAWLVSWYERHPEQLKELLDKKAA